ncbi:MAG: GlmU family protein [Bacteroidota bacterium]
MSTTLFDLPENRVKLLPFTYTRPVCEIRVGILTIREKWEKVLDEDCQVLTDPYLESKYPQPELQVGDLLINSIFCPNASLVKAIKALNDGEALFSSETLIACKLSESTDFQNLSGFIKKQFDESATVIERPWHIFQSNGEQIKSDFSLITAGRKSAPLDDPHTTIYNPSNVFLEEGATVRAAIINATDGPVYLGKNSQVHEGSIIKGPFALGEASHVNMGAKMKGDNTIGPHCKVGGEVSNSVFFGYSNKGHDGFLGNSVIGEWCNLGADTNSSNLKNNYSTVKVWDYETSKLENTGLQFCGLLMGDHSKAGINTMFNTGTVVGVSANVFGADFPPKFIPSFAWGGSSGFVTFRKEKSFEMCEAVMKRRKIDLSLGDKAILSEIMEKSASYRTWEEEK